MGKNSTGKLTNLESAFVAAVVSGKSYSDAYRITHDGADGLKPTVVAKKAQQFRKEHPRVDAEIERLKSDNVSSAIMSREELIADIQGLFVAALASSVRIDKESGLPCLASDKAANVSLRASERLSKLLGYDAEEKVDSTITIKLSPEVEEYAE